MTKVTDAVSQITVLKDELGVVRAYIDIDGNLVTEGTLKTDGGDGTVVSEPPAKTELDTNDLTTGITVGGEISIATASTFNVGGGTGYIVDSSNPMAVTVTKVTWTSQTNVLATFLGTADQTLLYIDNTGTLMQATIADFPAINMADYRGKLVLGIITHNDRAAINGTISLVNTAQHIGSTAVDLRSAIGCINITGNEFSAGTLLNINKSSGKSYFGGINQHLDANNPSIIIDSAQIPVTFNYLHRKVSGGYTIGTPTSNINPESYDNGSGTLASVTAGNYTIQRIYYVPEEGDVYVAYGQTLYTTLDAARKGVADEAVVAPLNLKPFLRCSLIVKQGTTNLSASDAVFAKTDKFGAHNGSHLIQTDKKASEIPLDAAINGQTNVYASLTDINGRVNTLNGEVFGENYTELLSVAGPIDIAPATTSLVKTGVATTGPLVTGTLPAGTYRIFGQLIFGGTGTGAPDLINATMSSTSTGPVTNTTLAQGHVDIPNGNTQTIPNMNFHGTHTLGASGTISLDITGTVATATMRIYQARFQVWRIA